MATKLYQIYIVKMESAYSILTKACTYILAFALCILVRIGVSYPHTYLAHAFLLVDAGLTDPVPPPPIGYVCTLSQIYPIAHEVLLQVLSYCL